MDDVVYAVLQDTLDATPLPENGIRMPARLLGILSRDDLSFMAANESALPPKTAKHLWRMLGQTDPVPDRIVIVVSHATHHRILAAKKHGAIRIPK